MPLRLLYLALISLGLSAAAWADDDAYDEASFPYDAFVVADDVYVRSGPGQNYYPVLRLKRGDRVEVYRHDPGGWYAIRPPAECFSWVSAEFVEPGEGRMATIKGDRVVARVGSAFSDIRDVIQIRMDEGELVEVLEAKRIGAGPAAQTWYKIAPPTGEFRWVSAQFISETQPDRTVRSHNPNNNLVIARHAKQHETAHEEPERDRSQKSSDGWREAEQRDHRDSARNDVRRREQESDREDEEYDRPRNPRNLLVERAQRTQRDDRDEQVDEQPTAVHRSRRRERSDPAAGNDVLLQQLEELDLELSAEVAKEPATWNLAPLRARSEQLLARSGTALDRGRVRLVQRKVARFEDIKQRHDTIVTAQLATDMRNRDVQQATLGGAMGVRSDTDRFDGSGKLTQVYPAQAGVASFALVDDQGKVTQYVTAAPGVNLRPYIGYKVGVQGALGFMPDAKTRHVTAKRVALVEETSTLR